MLEYRPWTWKVPDESKIGENIGASMSGITVSVIHNATCKWVMDYPTTPDRVLKALDKI